MHIACSAVAHARAKQTPVPTHTHTQQQQQQQPKVYRYIYGYDRIDCLINHDMRQSHQSALQELHISDLITMI